MELNLFHGFYINDLELPLGLFIYNLTRLPLIGLFWPGVFKLESKMLGEVTPFEVICPYGEFGPPDMWDDLFGEPGLGLFLFFDKVLMKVSDRSFCTLVDICSLCSFSFYRFLRSFCILTKKFSVSKGFVSWRYLKYFCLIHGSAYLNRLLQMYSVNLSMMLESLISFFKEAALIVFPITSSCCSFFSMS